MEEYSSVSMEVEVNELCFRMFFSSLGLGGLLYVEWIGVGIFLILILRYLDEDVSMMDVGFLVRLFRERFDGLVE